MTDTHQTPEPSQAETPTAPLPTAPQYAPVPDAVPITDPAQPYAQQPVHPHGVHVHHPVSEGAIALMVVGFLFFTMLSFGVGWHAHAVVGGSRLQQARFAGAQGLGAVQGRQGNFRGGPGMRGSGSCYGRGQSQGWSQDQGSTQLPPGHPDITN